MSRKSEAIVQGYLEKISSAVFDSYQEQITEFIGARHGVYALYRKGNLYYIGLATDLKRRIGHHRRDRHKGKWDHFSLYMIREEDQIRELESLLVRIANPSGNRVKGRLGKSKNLLPVLRRSMTTRARKAIDAMFDGGATRRKKAPKEARTERRKRSTRAKSVSRPLEGVFKGHRFMYATYKGIEHKAVVYRNGTIRLEGSLYSSPSSAARVLTGRPTNGWTFWKYREKSGELVPINTLRR